MAIAPASGRALQPIVDAVARAIGKEGLKEGPAQGAPAALRVVHEIDIERVVTVYWTPFQAVIPGDVVSLYLEVADPRPHWGEAYLSADSRNWIFFFAEREDGDVQLLYYAEYATPNEAIRGFFDHAGWYVLTATDKSWDDVVYSVEGLTWDETHKVVASAALGSGVTESLKKSTILWLRYETRTETVTMPVWYLYDQKVERLYVLSGERQQMLPEAERIRACDVILRWKGRNATVAELPATVRVITGEDSDWDEIADRVAEKRLNIPGLPEDTARRWRDECVILEIALR
ncbi:MAG: hypothetical protein QOG54_1645 [Actinomycetota bacterium]|jgi:hypothetical protein|nr:hypothetical protein [Actinomycetota bacterium]